MGNIREGGFNSVWNGRKYRSLRGSVNKKSDSICYSCRLPQFDSEDNRAAMQNAPSFKELLKISTQWLVNKPKGSFGGVMDKEFNPMPDAHMSSENHMNGFGKGLK